MSDTEKKGERGDLEMAEHLDQQPEKIVVWVDEHGRVQRRVQGAEPARRPVRKM